MDTGVSGLIAGILYGLLAAGLAVLLVAGGIIISFAEGNLSLDLHPSPTSQPASSTVSTWVPQLASDTPPPITTATTTLTTSPTPTSTATTTLLPAQTECPPPDGWEAIEISRGDTLNKLAQEYGTTAEQLIEANCLVESQLEPGSRFYVPGEVHPTPARCGPPPGWRYLYVVEKGDTLYSISSRAGVSVGQIKQANCLTSDNIRVGMKLYLPVLVEPPPPPAPTSTEVEPTNPPPTSTPEPVDRTPLPPEPTLEIPAPSGAQQDLSALTNLPEQPKEKYRL